jgi:hypothetical protein
MSTESTLVNAARFCTFTHETSVPRPNFRHPDLPDSAIYSESKFPYAQSNSARESARDEDLKLWQLVFFRIRFVFPTIPSRFT